MITPRTVSMSQDVGQLALRFAISASFLLAVADRFGYLGAPGDPGVSWGTWAAFRDYTARLIPLPVDAIVDVAAIGATSIEIVVAVLLILGLFTRVAAAVGATLTLAFGVTMFVFLGPLAPFRYPVFVFTAACLLLAGLARHRWSLDAARASHGEVATEV